MTTNENEIQKSNSGKLLSTMAAKYGLDGKVFFDTLKATVMKPGKDGRIPSTEEVAAFLMVANKYNRDPFTKEIYAFPDKRAGILPIVGIDGFTAVANRNDAYDGYDFYYSEKIVTGQEHKPCPDWAEVKIYRKDRAHPIVVREYLDEVYCGPKNGYSGPWQTHTKRMLRHKVLIQGLRTAFGISGIYDEDEAQRIAEAVSLNAPAILEMPKAKIVEAQTDSPESSALASEKQTETLNKLAVQAGLKDGDLFSFLSDHCQNVDEMTVNEYQACLKDLGVMLDQNSKTKVENAKPKAKANV